MKTQENKAKPSPRLSLLNLSHGSTTHSCFSPNTWESPGPSSHRCPLCACVSVSSGNVESLRTGTSGVWLCLSCVCLWTEDGLRTGWGRQPWPGGPGCGPAPSGMGRVALEGLPWEAALDQGQD